MQRIDSSGSINGLFSDGNPAIGQQATLLTAKWFNTIQEELAYLVTQNNIALNPNSNTQVYAAILKMITTAINAIDLPDISGGSGDPVTVDFSSVVPITRTITGGGLVTGGGDLNDDRVLSVTAATPEEAAAGLRNDRVLTPANVVGAGRVLSAFMNLPLLGGGILKAGATTISGNSSKTIIFPTAFPNDCVVGGVFGGAVSNNAQDNNPTATGWSATAMTAFSALDDSVSIRWFALGY